MAAPPKSNHWMCASTNPLKALVVASGCITCKNILLSNLKENTLRQHPKQQVLEWVVQSNKDLDSKKELVKKSFLVCGISNALDRSENHFVRGAKELHQLKVTYGLEEDATDDSEDDDPFESGSDSDSDIDSDVDC